MCIDTPIQLLLWSCYSILKKMLRLAITGHRQCGMRQWWPRMASAAELHLGFRVYHSGALLLTLQVVVQSVQGGLQQPPLPP